MKNNTGKRSWPSESIVAVFVFLIINVLTISSPATFVLAPVLLPVFLLYVLAANGLNIFLITAGVGLIPYVLLRDGRATVAMLIPIILMAVVQYLIILYRPKAPWAMLATTLAALLGIVINGYISIYVLQGSDFWAFSTQIAQSIQNELLATLSNGTYEVPPSQADSIRQLSSTITTEFIQDLIPGIVISWSMVSGYLSLRFAKRFLNFEHFKAVDLPTFGKLRINPFLLALFLAMSGSGIFLTPNNQRLSSLLFNTGFGVITFLGAIGAMSLIWDYLTVNLHYKRSFPKLVFTLASLYFFSGSWMTLLTIIDSVFDFRNTSGSSLWHWIRFKITQMTKEAD